MLFFFKVEKLLIEQNLLRDQKKLQEDTLALRDRELQNLQRTISAQPNTKVKQKQRTRHFALYKHMSGKGEGSCEAMI